MREKKKKTNIQIRAPFLWMHDDLKKVVYLSLSFSIWSWYNKAYLLQEVGVKIKFWVCVHEIVS
jgi:hypothetical protein